MQAGGCDHRWLQRNTTILPPPPPQPAPPLQQDHHPPPKLSNVSIEIASYPLTALPRTGGRENGGVRLGEGVVERPGTMLTRTKPTQPVLSLISCAKLFPDKARQPIIGLYNLQNVKVHPYYAAAAADKCTVSL